MSDNPYAKGLAELVGEQYIDGVPAEDTRNYTGEEAEAAVVQQEADEEVNENEADERVNENEPGSGVEVDDDDEGGEDEPEETDEPEEDAKKPKGRFQRRIDALTADVRRMERELKAERARNAAPKNADGSAMTPEEFARNQLKTDPKAPKAPDEYAKDGDGKLIYPLGRFDKAYEEDYLDYREARKEFLTAKAKEFSEQTSAPAKAAPTDGQDDFAERLEAFTAADEGVKGFKEAIAAAKAQEYPVSLTVARLIVDSEVGREVAVHLHQNPKLAKEIADLPEYQQAARFGKLEDKIAAQKAAARTARPTAAPKPLSKVRGRSTDTKAGYNSDDFEAVERRWKNENQPRRA